MVFETLAPRARWLFYLQALSRLVLFWAPATLVTTAVASIWLGLTNAVIGGVLWYFLMFLLALWYPSLAFDRWGWALRDQELLITRGVLIRSVTAIPVHRVQHVDTHQGPFEQWLGLARVSVYTASGLGADGVIPGLDLGVAEGLREALTRRRGDDGV